MVASKHWKSAQGHSKLHVSKLVKANSEKSPTADGAARLLPLRCHFPFNRDQFHKAIFFLVSILAIFLSTPLCPLRLDWQFLKNLFLHLGMSPDLSSFFCGQTLRAVHVFMQPHVGYGRLLIFPWIKYLKKKGQGKKNTWNTFKNTSRSLLHVDLE